MTANVPPFTAGLAWLYRLGLKVVLRALGRHEALHAVYGTGSMFGGKPLYGHSDVDLVLVFKPHIERAEGAHLLVARSYARVRRFFPFLGQWGEKSGNLIFLSEVDAGFPLSGSFRTRMKLGQMTLLLGDPVELDLPPGGPTQLEWLGELTTVVRVAIMTSERWTVRQVFWKSLFEKAGAVAEGLDAMDVLRSWSDDPLLGFLRMDRRQAYLRGADNEALFRRLMQSVDEIHRTLLQREENIRVRPEGSGSIELSAAPCDPPPFVGGLEFSESYEIPSSPLGLLPKLFYIPLDAGAHVVTVPTGSYKEVRALFRFMRKHSSHRDSLLVRMGPHLLLFTCQGSYVDVVPLDPVVHAPAHALVSGSLEYALPRRVFDELQADGDRFYKALRGAYQKHTGWLPARAFPEIFVEDDDDTIRDALDILRAYFARPPHPVVHLSSHDLMAFLNSRYPEASTFLGLLEDYYRALLDGNRGAPSANNLYRCLHQFVAQVLAGAPKVVLDEPDASLGMTVGIITYNRADELNDALESLAFQSRPPDEVVLVDNGSTDQTREVVESFEGRLPLRYHYLAGQSIPNARNAVLELASHEVVAFTDDDCGIPSRWLESIERAFLRADNVGLVGGWVAHWPAPEESAVDHYYSIFHGHKT